MKTYLSLLSLLIIACSHDDVKKEIQQAKHRYSYDTTMESYYHRKIDSSGKIDGRTFIIAFNEWGDSVVYFNEKARQETKIVDSLLKN